MHEPQNITRQLFFRELGMLGNLKVYHQLVALELLMADLGKEKCEQILGKEEYQAIFGRLAALEKILHRICIFYDFLEEEKINAEDKTSQLFLKFRRELEELTPSAYYPMLMALFKLARESVVWNQNIPSEVFKKTERKYQKIDYKEKMEEKDGRPSQAE